MRRDEYIEDFTLEEQSVSNSSVFVELDPDLCHGCGLCCLSAPNIFQTNQDGAVEIHQAGEPQYVDNVPARFVFGNHVREAFDAEGECPEEAIIITLEP